MNIAAKTSSPRVRRLLAVGALLMASSACGSAQVDTVAGERVAVPDHVTVVVPTGWSGDLATFVRSDTVRVRVLVVDAAGRVSELADLGLGSDAANPHLAQAERSAAVNALRSTQIPSGTGRADLLAGARVAIADSGTALVVTADTGCLTVAGQTLTGVDLSSTGADQVVGALDAAGILVGLTSSDDLLVLAGGGACASNGVAAAGQTHLLERLCSRLATPCLAREANTIA